MIDVGQSTRGVLACGASIAVVCAGGRSLAGRPAVVGAPVRVSGRISYGIYLWHWPLIVLTRFVLDLHPAEMALVAGVGATALAALSELVELPLRRSTARPPAVRDDRRRLAVGVVAALAVTPPLLERDRPPVVTTVAADTAIDAGVRRLAGAAGPDVERLLAAAPPDAAPVDAGEHVPSRAGCRRAPAGCIARRSTRPTSTSSATATPR